MFKSFTSSGNKPAAKGKQAPQGQATPPASVQRGVRLMLFGAPASIVFGIYGIIYGLVNKDAYLKSYHISSSGFTFTLILGFVFSLGYAALWVWIARASEAGRGWARIVATVLFFLWTYETYRSIGALKTYLDLGLMIIMLAIWGLGVAALYYLWRPESRAFFQTPAR